jgi:hypothetical protein
MNNVIKLKSFAEPTNLEEASIAARASMQEQGAKEVTTVDITPMGLITPEGQERVRVAMQKFENATALVANATELFLSEYGGILDDAASEDAVGRGDLEDDLRSLRTLIERRRREQDQFLRAVAGHRPA